MYMKNLNHKMTLRLNDDLKAYVDKMAEAYSISPSDFIRQCVFNTKASQEKAEQIIKNTFDEKKLTELAKQMTMEGLVNGIDRKTDSDNNI